MVTADSRQMWNLNVESALLVPTIRAYIQSQCIYSIMVTAKSLDLNNYSAFSIQQKLKLDYPVYSADFHISTIVDFAEYLWRPNYVLRFRPWLV